MVNHAKQNIELRQGLKLKQRIIIGSGVSILLAVILFSIFKLGYIPDSSAAATSALSPSSASTSGGNGRPWSNEGEVVTSDNTDASVSLRTTGSNTRSEYLELTDFGFSIPTTATILGIEINVERASSSSSSVKDRNIFLTKNGNNSVGSDYAETSAYWGTTDATATYGGTNDLWGTTWSYSEINSANFGVFLKVENFAGSNSTAYIDHVTITVYYDVPINESPGGVSSNIALWLKANTEVYENLAGDDDAEADDDVYVWKDNSGNANDASESGSTGTRPILENAAINYNEAIRFYDDGNEHLITSSLPVDEDMTWFVVYESNQSSSSNNFWENPALVGAESSGNSNDYTISQQGGKPFFKGTAGDNFGAQTASTFNNGRSQLLSATRVLSGAGTNYLYMNGAQEATYSSDNVTLSDPSAVGIGNQNDPATGSQFKGRIAEVIAYSSVLSSGDREKVESYLAMKYGMTVDHDYTDASGTTIWDQSTNSTFHNRITAIGRDDVSGLDQRQSRSVLGENVVSIGHGDIAVDNASNANSFSADESFVIFGDDNDDLFGTNETDYGTTTNAEVIDRRAARTWMLQESGTVGELEITFDLNNFPGVRANASTYDFTELRLLVDLDGVFATGAYSVSPTSYVYNASDTSITFHYNFGTGTSYFALGTLDETGSPLPVEFTYFNATPQDDKVELSWGTATETNNDYFEIERSQDGIQWESIATVQGAGTKITPTDYLDFDYMPNYGLSFYRIKQVDHDGTTDYSVYREVTYGEEGMSNLDIASVFPNPFNNEFTMEIKTMVNGTAKTEILNSNGSTMIEQTSSVVTGTNQIRIDQLGHLPKGYYIVKVVIGDIMATERILKR